MLPSANVSARVVNVLKTIRCVPPSVGASTSFSELGLDSLHRKDLQSKLEAEFRVELGDKEAAAFQSVQDVTNFFAGHPKAR